MSVSQARRCELRLEKLARRYGVRGPASVGFVAFGHDDERVVHTGQSRGDLRDDLVGEPKERQDDEMCARRDPAVKGVSSAAVPHHL